MALKRQKPFDQMWKSTFTLYLIFIVLELLSFHISNPVSLFFTYMQSYFIAKLFAHHTYTQKFFSCLTEV